MSGRHPKGTPGRIVLFCNRLPARLEKGKVGTIVLVADGLSETATIASWPYEAKDKPDALAEDVLEAAQGDCDGRGTTSQYLLQAVVDDQVISSYRVRCLPAEEDPFGGSADVNGIIAQALKHNEVMLRATLGSMAGVMQEMREVNSLLAKRIDTLEGTHREALELQKEALVLAASNESKHEVEEKKQERIDRLMKLGELWLMNQMNESKQKKLNAPQSSSSAAQKVAGAVVDKVVDIATRKEGA